MLRPFPGFVGPSYTSESRLAAFDRTVNLYPERIESGTGTARYALYPTPGYEALVSGLSGGVGRGIFSAIQRGVFFVLGNTFYQFPSQSRGAISNLAIFNDAPTAMVFNGDNGNQMLINADWSTYCYNLSTLTFTDVSGSTQCTSIDFLGGYGLRLDPNLSQFSFSAAFDFTTWDALDVVARSDAGDRWQRLIVFHNEIWLFGDATTSVYQLTDDPDIPFQPITSAFMNMGIWAPYSACIVDGTLMWLGKGSNGRGIVYQASGYNPERISTHAVEFAFSQIADDAFYGSSAEGSTYQQNGHTFYELTFPPNDDTGFAGCTWRYDKTEGLWSECGVDNGLEFECLDSRGHAFSSDTYYTVSRTAGTVYEQSLDIHTFNGSPIVRLRRAPHILDSLNRIRYSHLRLLMDVGTTTIVPPAVGSDPVLALRWSDDGGQTFSSSITTSTGPIGAYSTLVDFWQLGQGRDRIFEFTMSAPVPWRLVDCYVDYSVGPS